MRALLVALLVVVCCWAQEPWVGTFPDQSYSVGPQASKMRMCKISNTQYHGAYYRGNDVVGLLRGRVKGDKFVGFWIEPGGAFGTQEMTWIPANNSYVGNWYYEEKTITKRAHFTSNSRENVTAPSIRECFASENVNSAFYQGWWTETLVDGSTVQYKFCANLDTNRLSGVYTFSRNNRSGNIMGQLVDNGRVFSGIWYENSNSATSIGQLMFSMNDFTKSFFGVWWDGLNAFFTTNTNVNRTFVAVRTASEQPLVGDCMFERDVNTKYAQRWTGYFQEDLPLTPGMSLVNLRGKIYATYSRQLDAGVPLDIAGIAVGTVSDDGMSVTGTWVEIGDTIEVTNDNYGQFIWRWNSAGNNNQFYGTWGYFTSTTNGGVWNETRFSQFTTAYDAYVMTEDAEEKCAGQWAEKLEDNELSQDSTMYICQNNGGVGNAQINYWNGIGLGTGLSLLNDKVTIQKFKESGFRSNLKLQDQGNGVLFYTVSPWKTLRGFFWAYDPEVPTAAQAFFYDDTHDRNNFVQDFAKCAVRASSATSIAISFIVIMFVTALFLL